MGSASKEVDLVTQCKAKLGSFRIKELKEVLTQLGLSKQGRKQDLIDRILASVSDEETANTRSSSKKKNMEKNRAVQKIDEAYRKMQSTPSTDSSAKEQSGSECCSLKPPIKEVKTLNGLDMKISCPCRNSLSTDSMIQCVDPTCRAQQHIGCVIIPEKTKNCSPSFPPVFYCEMCRLKRADPYWVAVVDLVSAVKLGASNIPIDGTNPTKNVEKNFQLSRANRELLQDDEYDVQAWCMLLNDSVSFRLQWPQYAELKVNGMNVRVFNRPGHQLLGTNGRDDGPIITSYIGEGINKISLSGVDNRAFCFGVRLIKKRTSEQVLNLIPKEEDGELFEDALARVRRCIGGGAAMAHDDSDSDLEVISDSVSVNLRCPLSGSRMKVAGRFRPCAHMGCFDLETFVKSNQRSRKWQCPICLKNYSLEDVIIDRYFNRITTMMRICGEDITEVNVKPDGSWSAKTKGEFRDLAQWHLPDGSPYVGMDMGNTGQSKPESCSNQQHGGINEVGKHLGSPLDKEFGAFEQKVIMMSSSDTYGKEAEDIIRKSSIHIDSAYDDNEVNSFSPNFASAGIIILSDSDDETVDLVSPRVVNNTFPISNSACSLSAPPGISDPYESCLGLLNGNGNDRGTLYPYPTSTQADPGFQFFGTDSDISDAFIDLEQMSAAPMNHDTLLVSDKNLEPSRHVLNSSASHTNANLDSLVDNPLDFIREDPSIQSFLPSHPSCLLEQSDLGGQPPVSNGITSDWVALSLGIIENAELAETNGLQLTNQCGSNKALITDKNKGAKSNPNRANSRKLSDGPFSFPRQPRSVRQRVYLSVDSSSE
ncbi:E3 SUMO-protein ligase SIZ1-like [Argentina anserina]|uniref:E3 SUMO-protein ligase SIZ1-like n=1 Tax=Argentina anserina TaxID=57926 RepID=UPI00217687E2|nr:E3 SUMO-protein ligase SIZ1-like [Potentilla anserina]XP_050386176.1 E3 SUMO-protein ligase SIZ1-like [Potentilla anserina]